MGWSRILIIILLILNGILLGKMLEGYSIFKDIKHSFDKPQKVYYFDRVEYVNGYYIVVKDSSYILNY